MCLSRERALTVHVGWGRGVRQPSSWVCGQPGATSGSLSRQCKAAGGFRVQGLKLAVHQVLGRVGVACRWRGAPASCGLHVLDNRSTLCCMFDSLAATSAMQQGADCSCPDALCRPPVHESSQTGDIMLHRCIYRCVVAQQQHIVILEYWGLHHEL